MLSRGFHSLCAPAVAAVFGVLVAPVSSGCEGPGEPGPPESAPPAVAEPIWLGVDGQPLPYGSEDELLTFLREAEIVASNAMPSGVTDAHVLTLALGEARARAAFHDHHIVRERQRLVDGSLVEHFRDTYLSQVAAWEMARMLGMTNTPPTVLREVDGSTGSLQLWVEAAVTELDRRDDGLMFPDRIRAYRWVYDMDIFDALINNLDRSQGNFLWDGDWTLWMIDHTRAFGAEHELLKPRSVRRCSRRLWQALRVLDADEVDERLEPYMGASERAAVMARRDEILRLLGERIEREGEGEVLFSYDDPSSSEG